MKKKLVLVYLTCAVLVNFNVLCLTLPIGSVPSNYVVIGAFAIEENAVLFVQGAKEISFDAKFEVNPNRNLFYVYVLQTSDKGKAFGEARKIRTSTPFSDTWVYTGSLGRASEGNDVDPVTEEKLANIQQSDSPVLSNSPGSEKTVETLVTAAVTVDESKPFVKADEIVEGGRNFLFKIISAADQKEMQGDIDIIDLEKTKRITSYKGNQNVLLGPVNKSGRIELVCEVFGYRKIQREINFNQPAESEGVSMNEDQTIISFELTRLVKGDIAVMYNVYFYKDAGIMRPESRYEVTSLMEMMKENPNYKIKIHGHTNGGAAGKVISLGESKNYFSLTDTKEGFGSAKKLSQERANVIRDFLVSEGVDAKRMQIKAWGGKRPLHDKMSAHAQSNVRVEIEILNDK